MVRNTLTANGRSSFEDLENLFSPTQIQLSFKPKTFSLFFCHFTNLYQILKILEKKMIVIGSLLRKLQVVKDLVRAVSRKQCFRTPFDSQHVKESQAIVKLA